MSHIVTIQTEVRDPTAIAAACERLGLQPPVQGTAELFNSRVTGWLVQLPAWRYPLVCQTESGELHYDNFQGRWGAQAHLDAFLQRYAVEKTYFESRRKGHSIVEQSLPDGSIKLTIQLGGRT